MFEERMHEGRDDHPGPDSSTSDDHASAAPIDGPADEVLSGLAGEMEALAALDPSSLDDDVLHGAVVGLVRLASVLDAVTTPFVAEWDNRGIWGRDGSRAAGPRLARDAHCAERTGRRIVARARKCRAMPTVTAAHRRGALSSDHFDLLGRALQPHRARAFSEAEDRFVRDAVAITWFRDFERVTSYWCDAADACPGEADPEERRQRQLDARYTDAVPLTDGVVHLGGRLDAVDGAIFTGELRRLEQELFEADWTAARCTNGPDATADQLPRTARQRRADALVEMARRSAATPADARPRRPLVSVLVDLPTLTGAVRELFNGIVLTAGQVADLLTEADIERIVFDGTPRVIEVGPRARFFSGALRRAIEVRDRRCSFPGCEVPADDCQVDHIIEYVDGGLTTQDNGRLLCPTHNRQRPGRAKPATGTPPGDPPSRPPSGPTSGDPPSGPGSGDPSSGDPSSGDPSSGDPSSGAPSSGAPGSGLPTPHDETDPGDEGTGERDP